MPRPTTPFQGIELTSRRVHGDRSERQPEAQIAAAQRLPPRSRQALQPPAACEDAGSPRLRLPALDQARTDRRIPRTASSRRLNRHHPMLRLLDLRDIADHKGLVAPGVEVPPLAAARIRSPGRPRRSGDTSTGFPRSGATESRDPKSHPAQQHRWPECQTKPLCAEWPRGSPRSRWRHARSRGACRFRRPHVSRAASANRDYPVPPCDSPTTQRTIRLQLDSTHHER